MMNDIEWNILSEQKIIQSDVLSYVKKENLLFIWYVGLFTVQAYHSTDDVNERRQRLWPSK